jgi:hypothetical protein
VIGTVMTLLNNRLPTRLLEAIQLSVRHCPRFSA